MGLISDFSRLFKSKAKSQEIVLLMTGIKPVVRQGYYEEELKEIEEFCKENDLHLVRSPFKVVLDDTHNKFSNKGLRVKVDDLRKGMIFVYISRDEYLANLATLAELKNDHKELGALLGYPECCINYFCKNFSETNTNPQIESNNPYTNISKRNKDYVLLSHFPCSADCKKSIELAQKYLSVLESVDSEMAMKIFKELNK